MRVSIGIVIPVDLSGDRAKAEGVRNGDLLRVTRLRPTLDSGVLLQGHVFTQGRLRIGKAYGSRT